MPGVWAMLDGVSLFKIEWGALGADWTVRKPAGLGVAYVDSIRPAIRDWCRITAPALNANELATRVIAVAYCQLRNSRRAHFDEIRRGYAKLFQEQCIQQGFPKHAAAWEEVIQKLPG